MSKAKKIIKKNLKSFLKKNIFIHQLFGFFIYLYLKIVYLTSSEQFILPNNFTKEQFLKLNGTIFAFWHNRVALMFRVFEDSSEELNVLVSPHADGRIIKELVRKFNGKVIEGSTNKNPTGAVRKIIHCLSSKGNILLTPDGPRGPIYKINSNITEIARKYNHPIIPISCTGSKYFTLNSWDKLIIPLPFGKIITIIGDSLHLSDNPTHNEKLLEYTLMQLTAKAEELVKKK